MVMKIIPWILIIFPLIGFFVNPETMFSGARSNGLVDIIYFVFTLPWWGKLISILVGIVWLAVNYETDEAK